MTDLFCARDMSGELSYDNATKISPPAPAFINTACIITRLATYRVCRYVYIYIASIHKGAYCVRISRLNYDTDISGATVKTHI